MNPIKIIVTIIVLAATAITAIWAQKTFFADSHTNVQSHAPTLEKIQNLSQLVTNKIYVSDVLTASNKDYQGQWVINGDALITIDLNQAQLKDMNEETKTATLILPEPGVTSPRVDHTRTKKAFIKGVRFALLRNRKNKAEMEKKMMEAAQESVEKAASRPEIIENSKKQAALILSNMYLQLGWKLDIQWQHQDKEL